MSGVLCPSLNDAPVTPNWFMEIFDKLLGLGLESRDLGVGQICLRGVIVFIATIIIVQLGHKRFMARLTAFDVVLGFLLASVLARGINGSAPFGATLAVGLLLVLLHRMVSALAFYSHRFSGWVKGNSDVLVVNGKVEDAKLRKHKISRNDVLEEARLNGKIGEMEDIRIGTLERNGRISVIPRKQL